MDRCFACDRKLGKNPKMVDTRDAQTVYVGSECYKLVKAAGEAGYQPPTGGPRLWLMATRDKLIEKAGDDCRENAHATVVERMGAATYRAMNFNGQLNADTLETIAQAAYFADQAGVTKAEVLAYLNITAE